jgi:hypothetical protein
MVEYFQALMACEVRQQRFNDMVSVLLARILRAIDLQTSTSQDTVLTTLC